MRDRHVREGMTYVFPTAIDNTFESLSRWFSSAKYATDIATSKHPSQQRIEGLLSTDVKDSSSARSIGGSRSGRESASQRDMGQVMSAVVGSMGVIITNAIEMSSREDGVKWDGVQKVASIL